MIKGIGIDICDTRRMRDAFRRNRRFINKVFDPREIKYCRGRKSGLLNFAGRFAAKEAFIKAVAVGKMIRLKDIVILNKSNGEPHIFINPAVREALKRKKARSVTLSISHINDVSAAVCVLE